MKTFKQGGFMAIEVALLLVIVGLIGGTGYYVWHSTSQTNKTLTNASDVSQNAPKVTAKTIKTFDDCKKAAGSKIQETFPEVCVTKNGKSYVNSKQKAASVSLPAEDKYSIKTQILPNDVRKFTVEVTGP